MKRLFQLIICICCVCLFSVPAAGATTNEISLKATTISEGGTLIRQAMKSRIEEITLTMPLSTYTQENPYLLYEEALKHTKTGDEGDYIRWQIKSWNCDIKRLGSSVLYAYHIRYYSSVREEELVAREIEKLEKTLALKSTQSDYEKFLAIYNYLCKNIAYDKNGSETNPYSAYCAIVKKKAVCQGYATLFYRLLLDAGIDNRIVVSQTHAWNLVKIDESWYESDVTWDASRTQQNKPYIYMLRANLATSIPQDKTHDWMTSQLDKELLTLPRAKADYEPPITAEKRKSLKENGTFLLMQFDYYAQYASGKTTQSGSYSPESELTLFGMDAQSFFPLKRDRDYTLSIKLGKQDVIFTIQGIGAYKDTITIRSKATLYTPKLTVTTNEKTGKVKLTWNAHSGTDTHIIYRKQKDKAWKKIKTTTKNSYTDVSVMPGTYSYMIKSSYQGIPAPGSNICKVVIKHRG